VVSKRENDTFVRCGEHEFDSIYFIINEAAAAYRGLIPPAHFKDPYMSRDELRSEINAGVEFWGYKENTTIQGVMGIQRTQDVVLIRHAYTKTEFQGAGIGSGLLKFLLSRTQLPVLIGTWARITRAIQFYQRHGFTIVTNEVKDKLLRQYWQVPGSQISGSVVLANVSLESLKL
tara:strand:+ start:442 stop:966 length:525 start_codon:yes stop_codon:yes gene_type:complete